MVNIMLHSKRFGQIPVSFIIVCVILSALPLIPGLLVKTPLKKTHQSPKLIVQIKKPVKKPAKFVWHPPHTIKSWTTTYRRSRFRLTQIPRCKHIETLLTYDPSGETLGKAKRRVGGISAMSGSFHHSQSYALADFFQRGGRIISPARTGRIFLVILPDGSIDLTKDYAKHKRRPGVSGMAMGQVLVPWQRDGFGIGFANRDTDRMAMALNRNYIFVIQGKSDLWTLASYIKNKLPVKIAANSDGGHVVRGTAPVHVVFRWKPKGIVRDLLK